MRRLRDGRERIPNGDSGFAALWVAVIAVFLVGAAALAVDASGGFHVAQSDQNIADLSCLAGVRELPDDATSGITVAVAYGVDNWPKMSGNTISFSGTTGTYADGAGNEIYVDAAYGGDTSKMYVRIREVGEAYFSKVVGTTSIPVTQEAFCRVNVQVSGGGSVPFGALPGGYGGGLQAPNPCGSNSGNCGALWIDRSDVNGTSATLINNIAKGSDRDLAAWLGSQAGSVHCSVVSAGQTCHQVETDTGVSASHLGEGFLQRLENDPGATCTTSVNGRTINCDSPSEVLGSAPTPLIAAFPSQPSFWDTSLHGTYNAANTTNHFYYNGIILKCDSPRIALVPIISSNLNWDLGDPNPGWPNGKKDVKIVGFYSVIIVDPNDGSDWQGSGNLKTASSVVVWYGPSAECQGSGGTTYPWDPFNPSPPVYDVFLVDSAN